MTRGRLDMTSRFPELGDSSDGAGRLRTVATRPGAAPRAVGCAIDGYFGLAQAAASASRSEDPAFGEIRLRLLLYLRTGGSRVRRHV